MMKWIFSILLVSTSLLALGQEEDSLDSLLTTLFDEHYPRQFSFEDESFSPDSYKLIEVYFSFDQSKILPESLVVLDSVKSFLLLNEDISVDIEVHTDSRGNDNYCQKLSQRRAQCIVDYLISKGIAETRMTPIGFSETDLIVSDVFINSLEKDYDKERAHAFNRRVMIRITQI